MGPSMDRSMGCPTTAVKHPTLEAGSVGSNPTSPAFCFSVCMLFFGWGDVSGAWVGGVVGLIVGEWVGDWVAGWVSGVCLDGRFTFRDVLFWSARVVAYHYVLLYVCRCCSVPLFRTYTQSYMQHKYV